MRDPAWHRTRAYVCGADVDVTDCRSAERGVSALGHAELRPEGLVLSCGDGAVLGDRSAAALWGMRPRSGAFVEVTASGRGGRRERSGIRIRGSAISRATQARSDLEAAMLQLCLDHRLPRPQVNRYDGTRELDLRWPGHRLVVEVDGSAYHRTRAAFDSDRARDRALLRAGWRVARFTDRQRPRPGTPSHEFTALLTPHASAEMCRRGGGA